MGDNPSDPISAGVGAAGGLIGGGLDMIGQANQNRRQGKQGAQSAKNLNDFIQSTLLNQDYSGMVGDEAQALRDSLITSANQTAGQVQGDARGMREAAGDIQGSAVGLGNQAQRLNRRADQVGQYAQDMGRSVSDVRRASGRVTGAGRRMGDVARDLRGQAQDIRQTDTTGLEAAARRQLEEQSGILDAQLAGRGAFSSGRARRDQRRLAGDVFSNLASEINADQFQRAQAAGQFTQAAGGLYGDQANVFGQAGQLGATAGQLQQGQGQLTAAAGGLEGQAGDMFGTQGQLYGQAGGLFQGAGQLGLGAGQLQQSARQGAMDDQFRRQAEKLADEFQREGAAGEIMTLPAFSFLDTQSGQATNQGK